MTTSTTSLTPIGGPTVLLEMGGFRFLVDPTFDDPSAYPIGTRALTKTQPAGLTPEAVGAVDAVLLSHDQHPDNLDHGGRAYVAAAALTLTTPLAAQRLGGSAVGLEPWQEHTVRHGEESITVTAVPALHGPEGSEELTGPVTGFVLSGTGQPSVYVSGDNASLSRVGEIAARFPRIDGAVLFAGAARTPLMDAYLTLTSEQAAEAAAVLGCRWVLPVHTDGWEHFTQDGASFAAAFEAAGLGDRLVQSHPGRVVTI